MAKTKQPVKLPSVWQLSRQTWLALKTNLKLLIGVTAVYLVASLLFTQGYAASVDVASLTQDAGHNLAGGIKTYVQLVGGSASNSSNSQEVIGVYQALLAIVFSLAIIWSLRQVWQNRKPKFRDAYYKGMFPIIPFGLLLLLVIVQMLPLLLSSSIYQLLVQNSVITASWQMMIAGLVVVASAILTWWWLTATLLGLYIVTLPDMTPIKAWRLAAALIKGRRWLVARKLLFMPLAVLLVLGVILVPFILILPSFVPLLLTIFGSIALVVVHAYVYNLYQELMGESYVVKAK